MKSYDRFLLLAAIARTLLAATIAFSSAAVAGDRIAGGNRIVVIVNASNPVGDLTLEELKALWFSHKRRWDTGRPVLPVMIAEGAPEREAFLKIVCGTDDAAFKEYFLRAAFTGRFATPPKEVSSAQSVKDIVANSPGAIGFISARDFSSEDIEIKPVGVQGATAADPAYKLKM